MLQHNINPDKIVNRCQELSECIECTRVSFKEVPVFADLYNISYKSN